MKRIRPILLIALTSILFTHTVAEAQLELKTLETDNMRVVYFGEDEEYILPHLARCFENSMGFYRGFFKYTPSEKITLILRDLNDHGYAGATSLPINYLIIGIEPYEQVYETSPTNERLNWVMSHELLHVLASDQAAPTDRFFRKLFFGKVNTTDEAPVSMLYSYMTSPRHYAPRWYHEGMAVFMETWLAGGYGRAIGGYDEMVFRTMVDDDAYFYDVVGLQSEGTTIDFQVGQVAYLYGTRFMSYLAYHFGPEKLLNWLNRTAGTKRNFAAQFKHVYGASLDSEWSRWIEWEHGWQQTNLDSIAQYTPTPYRRLSKRPLGSVSRAYYDPGSRKLYTAVLYPAEMAHIVEIDVDTWESRKIMEIRTPALYFVSSLAYDESSGTMFYTTDNSHQWRDLNMVSVKTRESRTLMKDIRTGDLAFNRADKSLWGIRHHRGLTRLVRLEPPYDDGQELLTLPYGKDMFDIDISPDGQYLTASLMDVGGKQRLIRMSIDDLMLGDTSFETLYEFGNYSPANFVFSPDGRYLFGTTYSTGVSNVVRYEFMSGRMDWITNARTGYFRPVPVSDDSLIAFRFTANGFEPVMIPNTPLEDVAPIRFLGQAVLNKYPELRGWMLDPPTSVDIDSLALVPHDYRGLASIRPTSIYPVSESYKSRAAWGLRFNLQDPLWLNGIEISASVTPTENLPDNERVHLMARYSHWPWEVKGTLNRADFYDFFGPTKTSRKGYSIGVQYEGILVNERPRHLSYTLDATAYGDLEKLPDYQNVAASFDKNLTASANLEYHSYGKTIGGVEREKGIKWELNALNNHVNTKSFPRYWVGLDYGFPLPWDHSSIWLRSSLGNSHGERNEPFANYFFGGFGNNWVDHSSISRYRQYYAFPGVELNEVAGRNFGRLMMEWALPPVRFRRLGVPRLYTTWAHLRLFSTALTTNFDNLPIRRTLLDFGAQIDFKLVIFSSMSSTFSLGYAAAVEKNERLSDEFMISLRILQ